MLIGAAVVAGVSAITWEGTVMPGLQAQAGADDDATTRLLRTGTVADLEQALRGLEDMPGQLDPLKKTLYDLNVSGVKVHTEALEQAIRDEIANRKAAAQSDAIAAADLKERAAILKRAIDSGHVTASGEDVLKTQARNVERRASPIRTGARATEAREAGMSAAEQAVFRRALAAGRNPTDEAIARTIAKNTATAADETRKAALAQAISARVQAIASAVTNMRLAAIVAKDWAVNVTVPVTVQSTVSVRGMSVAQSVRAAYNHGTHVPGSGR